MATKMQVRRDSYADWISNDPTLSEGEVGLVTDNGTAKTGDGSTAWTSLKSNISIYKGILTKTADYSLAATDIGKLVILTSATSADKTFTLPTLVAGMDGMIFRILNDSYYNLTVSCGATDHVWNSGTGYGIDMPDKGTIVTLMADFTNTKWHIIEKTGGIVKIQGLVLMEPITEMGVFAVNDSNTQAILIAKEGRHTGYAQGNVINTGSSKFLPSCLQFDGTGDYIFYSDSPDWDIFGDQTGHKTVAFWVYHNATGSVEEYIRQYEDGSNRWGIYKSAGDALGVYYDYSGGGPYLNATGGSISATTWTHIALVINGAESGLYINGLQVIYDATFTVGTVSGSLYIGQSGSGTQYLAGRMQDLFIAYNNPFNASPNSTPDDSFTIPGGLVNFVM